MTLSSASQDSEGKSDMSSRVASKRPPEEEVSRMGPMRGYDVEVVQDKYVPSALNASTNFPTILMRKDA